MIITRKNLESVYQTGEEMRRLASFYYSDLGRWLAVPFFEFYRFVCRLPYIPDPEDVETVSRPLFTLDSNYGPRDCDDKAVLLGSWFKGHGEKLRFVASSTRPDQLLHHVFMQHESGLYLDATYDYNAEYIGFYPYFPDITKIEALTDFF